MNQHCMFKKISFDAFVCFEKKMLGGVRVGRLGEGLGGKKKTLQSDWF